MIEQLREKVKAWVEPVSPAAPAGTAARANPRYEAVLTEIARLESPTGGSVDWGKVIDSGGHVLQSVSKDLRVATHVAYALFQTQGLEGLATGLVAVAEILDRYWEGLFPELTRMRGRANAMAWLIDRVSMALSQWKVEASTRGHVEPLEIAASHLAEVARRRFEAHGPAIRPLLESIQRLKASLPEEAPVPPPPAPEEKPATPVDSPAAAPAQPPSRATPAVAMMEGIEGAIDFLRQTGSALVDAAIPLRRASSSEPLPYRILRVGLYLHLAQPPAADGSGKTAVPAPPTALRERIERMSANGKWAEVLEESESALVQHRFWVDLHGFSARALKELGPAFQDARQALLMELRAWLERMPRMPALLFADGSPVASAETRAWLEAELRPPAVPVVALPAARPEEGEGTGLAEVHALLEEGKAPEAIALLQKHIEAAPSQRQRFRLRLAQARICAASGQPRVARALFQALDRESVERGLDLWEPTLSAECLEGWLGLSRPAAASSEESAWEFNARYRRLCLIDPSAALRLPL